LALSARTKKVSAIAGLAMLFTPSQWLISYVEAYNAISKSAIKRKYGPDVFDKCFEEAAQAFVEKHMSRDEEMRPIATGQN
jgi:hypothetical protein